MIPAANRVGGWFAGVRDRQGRCVAEQAIGRSEGGGPGRVIGLLLAGLFAGLIPAQAQLLLNVDFGSAGAGPKTGLAAAGLGTNDFWNLYAPYRPRFSPETLPIPDGRLAGLLLSDRTPTSIEVQVRNAPGVWGNATGDPMLDTYLFAANGSNIVLTLDGLGAGNYHFYLYGHAAADVAGEQNSAFSLRSGTNRFGPASATLPPGWRADQPWRERAQYVLFRDVPVLAGHPVRIEAAGVPPGVAVINGLQVLSRGTGAPRLVQPSLPPGPPAHTNLLVRSVHYAGGLADGEARFEFTIEAESLSTNLLSEVLFEGDLALVEPRLPAGWRMVHRDGRVVLVAGQPGTAQLRGVLLARIEHQEPWNRVDFRGPPAAIATLDVRATQPGMQVELLSGTPDEVPATGEVVARGALGIDRRVALRWQSRTTEVTRAALVTVDTASTLAINPAVARFTTRIRGEVLQGRLARFQIALPSGQTLAQLEAALIRDWQVVAEADRSLLLLDFLKPAEGAFSLTLTTEQPLGNLPGEIRLSPPQPLDVQRESGSIDVTAEDVDVRFEEGEGLRQVNAAAGVLAAHRFHGRPAILVARLGRVLPEIQVVARVSVQAGDTLLSVRHALDLEVSRAGIYACEAALPDGWRLVSVQGEGIEDWSAAGGRLRVQFRERVLGRRGIELLLEQGHTGLPPELTILPVRVAGAVRETTRIGAGSAPGILLKTGQVEGLREMPVTAFEGRTNELLAFRAEEGGWRLGLLAERMEARVVAEVFNLITIGDGLVGGSATLRFGILNQGVQQFRVRLPEHWRNLEFTGPNIRRKDREADVWTIALQEKAWGGYTLVVTYDYPFDPQHASLDLAGAQPRDVLRDSGIVAVTTAAGLQVNPGPIVPPLRRIDVSEIPEADRSLIARPVLFACRYDSGPYRLPVDLVRHEEVQPLDAVADRTQLTTVLTEAGEMLTQAGFMVKNNDRQFQRFRLPPDATLWGVYVNGEPARAERDGDWLLVSLPRTANRDQVFAVDLKYAQQPGPAPRWLPQRLELVAPRTDVPSTYAEWEWFVPTSRRLAGFGGNMTAASGTVHGFGDAWRAFTGFYRGLWIEHGAVLIIWGGLSLLVASVVIGALRRGARAVMQVLLVFTLLAVLAGMLLPALAKAKAKAQRISSVNNLKQIALAARIFAADNQDRLPNTFEEMMDVLVTPRVLIDPETAERYTYVGAGKSEADPFGILAYSSAKHGRREVAFVDGSVRQLSEEQFQEALAREAVSRGQQLPGLSPTMAARYGLMPGGEAVSGAPPPSATVALDQLAVPGLPAAVPTATGIRSIRIDLPRTGRPFHFTKILNVDEEPLRVTASMTRTRVHQVTRMLLQLTTFLCGLVLAWTGWRRDPPRSFRVAVGVALMLFATASLLLAWRMLHVILIASVPAAVVAAALAVLWMRRRRGSAGGAALPVAPGAALSLLLAALFGPLPLRGSSSPPPAPDPATLPAISIVSAACTGRISPTAATLDFTLAIRSAGTNQILGLFGDDVALQTFTIEDGEARLWRENATVGLFLSDPGLVTARLRLLVRVQEAGDRRRLTFRTPAALATRMDLLIEEAEADVEFPAAVTWRSAAAGQATRVEAILGGAAQVDLSWTPRMKRAADVPATVFSQVAARVAIGEGVVNARTRFDYQVTQGELRQVRLRLPAGHQVLRVEGEFIRFWDVAGAAGEELVVTLTRPVAPAWRLMLETEATPGPLPVPVAIVLPRTLEVTRESGALLLTTAEDVGWRVEHSSGLQRVDDAGLSALFDQPAGVVGAHRFVAPDFELRGTAEQLQPSIDAVVQHRFRVAPEQVLLEARIETAIKRAGLFTLRIALPDGPRLESVTGAELERWIETRWDGRRCLELTLRTRTLGEVSFDLRLVQPIEVLPPALDLVGVRPLGVQKLSDFIGVSAEAGTGIKTVGFDGLAEIPPSALGQPFPEGPGSGVLAFRFLAPDADSTATWRLRVATEPIEPWVRAEIVNIATVTETLILGRARVRFDVQNAPAREFHLKMPSDYANIDIQGANLRRRDHTNGVWRVELQSPVRGLHDLTVTWEQPRSPDDSEWRFAGVEALEVERDTGYVVFRSRSPVQVLPRQTAGDLNRIDIRELPEWAGVELGSGPATDAALLAYRYLRPGYAVTSGIQQFEEAALLQTLVESLHLISVVSDDGQQITEMTLSVRNKGRQHLELTLPPNVTVWSAFVGGQPVRPTRRQERLLLPIDRLGATDEPVAVRVTYVGRVPFPATRGRVSFASPAFSVPLKDARWDLFLPADYEYRGFGGSMALQTTELAPLAQEFTLAEYTRQEVTQAETSRAEVAGNIRRARTLLSAGKVQEAVEDLNRFRAVAGDDDLALGEWRQIEEELNRGQASNLLQAQRDYTFANVAKFQAGPAPDQTAMPVRSMDEEEAAARRQVEVLQKMQAIGATRVQPLRVNLPTRGLRHSFVQALQTEVDRPLTVRFSVRHTRETGGFSRLVLAGSGFLILWFLTALALRFRSPEADDDGFRRSASVPDRTTT